MKKFVKSLSVVVAILLAMTLSVAVLADESSEAVNESSVASDVSNTSSDASGAASDAGNTSSEASKAESSAASSTASSESEAEASESEEQEAPSKWATFPWARVISVAVILIIALVLFILAKTKTKLGQRIAKFFKEYWSEMKKVSWMSPKDMLKATGVVLVFLIVAAVAIGVLDFGFTQLVKLLATIFN